MFPRLNTRYIKGRRVIIIDYVMLTRVRRNLADRNLNRKVSPLEGDRCPEWAPIEGHTVYLNSINASSGVALACANMAVPVC